MIDLPEQLPDLYATTRVAAVSIARTVCRLVLWFMALCGVSLWVAIAIHAYGAGNRASP